MPSNSCRMSRMESIATPAIPTSPCNAGMVGVVAAVGGQVEGHRQALLAGGQVTAVERVGVRGGGEPGVLPDGPRLVDIHRRIGPAHERRLARETVQRVALGLDGGTVGADVHRFDVDAFRRVPHQLVGRVPVRCRGRGDMLFHGGFGRRLHGALAVQRDVGEAADHRCGGRHRRSCPQPGEQGRKSFDRIDFRGQETRRAGVRRRYVGHGLLRPGQADLLERRRRVRPRRLPAASVP